MYPKYNTDNVLPVKPIPSDNFMKNNCSISEKIESVIQMEKGQ